MKSIVVIALLICWAVAAQAFDLRNPGGVSTTALTGGTVVRVSENPNVAHSARERLVYLVSTEGRFYASFWRYDPDNPSADANGYVKVSFNTSADGDTLTVPANIIYPAILKFDHIFLRGDSVPVDVDVYWYE